jgi:hypothetical protein
MACHKRSMEGGGSLQEMKASLRDGCPYGCVEGFPVCQQGKRLFEKARAAAQQLPACQSVSPSEQEWHLFEVFWQAADAYLAHIGQGVGERYE